MARSPDQPPPMAVAMEWVSRIFAIALEMFLPGVAGSWVDRQLGTSFLGPLGFVFGLVFGIWHLIIITKQPTKRRASRDGRSSPGTGDASRPDRDQP